MAHRADVLLESRTDFCHTKFQTLEVQVFSSGSSNFYESFRFIGNSSLSRPFAFSVYEVYECLKHQRWDLKCQVDHSLPLLSRGNKVWSKGEMLMILLLKHYS